MHISRKHHAHSFMFMLLAGGMALAAPEGHELLFKNAQNATALTDADRRAIFDQLGLKVAADG